MKRNTLGFCLRAAMGLGMIGLPAGMAFAHPDGPAPTAAVSEAMARASAQMGQAAANFWASLTPDQQKKCGFEFKDEERFNWHFIPRERKGITWNDLTPSQMALAHAFLASGLSQRGYMQAETIMSLDQILKEMEAGRAGTPRRDSGNYAFSIFGTPGPTSTWGWRVEGHHLSLNITIIAGKAAIGGPVFFGSNPAEVRDGQRKGVRVLGAEEDLGFALIRGFDDAQRKKAIVEAKAPNEIITGNSRKSKQLEPVGIAASELKPEQKKLLVEIVEFFANRLRPELAQDDIQKIESAGWDKVQFAWAGATEAGQGHYYRIQGPTFLIEFDNTQNNANHVHSVWRDATNDFGEDVLRQHYDADHPGK